jgi:hypothetical protein
MDRSSFRTVFLTLWGEKMYFVRKTYENLTVVSFL